MLKILYITLLFIFMWLSGTFAAYLSVKYTGNEYRRKRRSSLTFKEFLKVVYLK